MQNSNLIPRWAGQQQDLMQYKNIVLYNPVKPAKMVTPNFYQPHFHNQGKDLKTCLSLGLLITGKHKSRSLSINLSTRNLE